MEMEKSFAGPLSDDARHRCEPAHAEPHVARKRVRKQGADA